MLKMSISRNARVQTFAKVALLIVVCVWRFPHLCSFTVIRRFL